MKKYLNTILFVSLAMFLMACGQNNSSLSSQDNSSLSSQSDSSLSSQDDSSLSSQSDSTSSKDVSSSRAIVAGQLYNDSGLVVKFNPKGARISSIEWNGTQIAKDGFIAGRCANRIANATFELNGITYNLNKNNGKHHLHGGAQGFGEINWTLEQQTFDQMIYSLHSADGNMGYPGNLDITVTYTLMLSGELTIEYNAISDADTLLNPINHLYMSLNQNNSSANHSLQIAADSYTEKDSELIPTGNILSVTSTRFDFRTKKTLAASPAYDDNYVLNGEGYRKVATMTGNTTGIQVEVYTDRPGLQLYNTSSHICLETQLFPDAIHHSNFPSPVLLANEEFYSKTAYIFTDTIA